MTSYQLAFAIGKYFEYGGLQRDMHRIASVCAQHGHQVHILTGDWQGARPGRIKVHLLDLHAKTNHGRNEKLGQAILELSRHEHFDCIIGFNKVPGLDVYFAGDPCLAAGLEENKPAFFRWLPRYRTYLRQEAAVFHRDSNNTEILLISEKEKDKIIRHYGMDENRFHLLPPGIDRSRLCDNIPSKEKCEALRRQLDLQNDDVMILNVGSSFRTKGIDRAIIALSNLPDQLRQRCRLVVVGDGKSKPFLKLAEKHGIAGQVIFTGGSDEVAKFYYSADLLLHPARTENTGLTLLESLVCALPVLVTGNCGYAFHISRANAGLVCPEPFKQSQLNALLLQMIQSERRHKWRQNALAYCKSTDLYSMTQRAADVIIQRAARNRQSI